MRSILILPQWLLASLKDPTKAAAYLNEALKLGDREVFIEAIKDVCDARSENIHRMMRPTNLEDNEEIMTEEVSSELEGVVELLDALGFRIVIEEKKDHFSYPLNKCLPN